MRYISNCLFIYQSTTSRRFWFKGEPGSKRHSKFFVKRTFLLILHKKPILNQHLYTMPRRFCLCKSGREIELSSFRNSFFRDGCKRRTLCHLPIRGRYEVACQDSQCRSKFGLLWKTRNVLLSV